MVNHLNFADYLSSEACCLRLHKGSEGGRMASHIDKLLRDDENEIKLKVKS